MKWLLITISIGKEAIHVVVDTNVFIDDPDSIITIIKCPQNDDFIIYVPWVVIQELDKQKNDRRPNVRLAARKAARELKALNSNPKLIGQNGIQNNEAAKYYPMENEVPDDRLIQACLQLKLGEHKTVQLFTSDHILIVKAHTFGIPIFQKEKIKDFSHTKDEKIKICKKVTKMPKKWFRILNKIKLHFSK